MSTEILHAALDTATLGPASRYILETREAMLADETEELEAVRFSIILTARWEATEEDAERRSELLEDLELLRRHYGDKIDEIAMTFGVAQAMKIKEEVERSVVVPRDARARRPKFIKVCRRNLPQTLVTSTCDEVVTGWMVG